VVYYVANREPHAVTEEVGTADSIEAAQILAEEDHRKRIVGSSEL